MSASSALVTYDAARRALAEALTVAETLEVRGKIDAIRTYARMAKDRELEARAAELRIRAERHLGLQMAEQRETGGLAPAHFAKRDPDTPPVPTLDELGIDKRLAAIARRYAEVADAAFEAELATRRKRIEAGTGRITVSLFDWQVKAARRAEREAELAGKIRALPDKRYGVILGDPAWEFETWSEETGMDRAAANHYPTSPLDDILALDVASIAAKDCALFLWATVPMLPQALQVMGAWGFAYASHFAWVKDKRGKGYWNRNAHELLLLGTRGIVPCPAPGDRWASILAGPVTTHSAKPESSHQLIEAYFPVLPKIELNRRGTARPGWDAWGLEAETEAGGETDAIEDAA